MGPCHACATANAPRLPHPHSKYLPSYSGRVIHADIAGPFVPTGGGHKYLLVLVDNHSRFKVVYFLKARTDASACVKRLLAEFNALLNSGRSTPAIPGQLAPSTPTMPASSFPESSLTYSPTSPYTPLRRRHTCTH
eukprot:4822731-Pleurochrysis_carterae.AAC.2